MSHCARTLVYRPTFVLTLCYDVAVIKYLIVTFCYRVTITINPGTA